MIKSIKLQNFKSHKDTELVLKPISIFIGNNNSGKSSTYQSLLLLRDAVRVGQNQLVTIKSPRNNATPETPFMYNEGKSIDVYDYDDVVFKTGNAIGEDNPVSIEVSAELFIPIKTLVNSDRWQIKIATTFRQNRLVSHSGSILFSASGDLKVQWSYEDGIPPSVSPESFSIDGTNINFEVQKNLNVLSSFHSYPANLATELKEKARNLCNEINNLPKRLFFSFRTVYPIRGLEESVLPLPKGKVSSGDHFFHADRQVMLAALLAYDRKLENLVSEYMTSMFGVGIEVELRPPYQILVKTKITRGKEDSEASPRERTSADMFVNEGLGINQMPFMLVPLAMVDKGETVIICEPEAHLNPMIQSKLVEALARVSLKQGIQLVIETHSEHILNAFIYRVMRKEIPSEDLGIYHFEMKGEVSSVREIEIGRDGRLKEGLPGFFDVSLEELSQTLRALSK